MAYRKDQVGPGFVYVLRNINPANINEIKIGLTNDAEFRRKGLSGTSNPFPFAFERVWAVSNMAFAEDIAQTVLADHRMNMSREFFYIVPLHAHEALFGNLWYQPSEDQLDACLEALLDGIENMFDCHDVDWYEVDHSQLPGYSRAHRAAKRRKPGAMPPEPLF